MSDSDSGGVSRRDFLRRASKQAAKEAVDMGTKVVPAAGLVRTLLQTSQSGQADAVNADTETGEEATAVPSEASEETAPPPSPTLTAKNPLAFLAAWRAKRHNRDDDTH